MAFRIWKQSVPISDALTVSIPQGAQILCVQIQHGQPTIWMRVEETAPLVDRALRWRGTGHNADDVGAYVGTIQLDGGSLVFHLFDKGES